MNFQLEKEVTFFITSNKLTGELVLQENNLVSLKIPKQWQKPDSDINNPALWVCHLPANSLGIVYISLYPNELIIKKKNSTNNNYSEQKQNSLIVYKGILEPNGENGNEIFYRCKLELQEEQNKGNSSAAEIFVLIFFLVLGIIVFAAFSNK